MGNLLQGGSVGGMKHTAPQFWHYALAHFFLGGGSLAIVLNLFLEEKSDLAGLIMIWFGIIVLLRIKRVEPKEPSPDNTEDGEDGEETPPED